MMRETERDSDSDDEKEINFTRSRFWATLPVSPQSPRPERVRTFWAKISNLGSKTVQAHRSTGKNGDS